jgi:thioredoxin-like negative regulator of GroEL
MIEKEKCIWCGRSGQEAGRLFSGPVLRLCSECVNRMTGAAASEEASLAARVREEIDHDVQQSFQHMIKSLNLGPLHDKYQRLMRVKFKEEAGSPTFSEVFAEFKKGVEAEVPSDDYQTRYDLAIAYHEMGLAEDAFREMLASLRGALRQKNYDKSSEIISALIHFHEDSARVIRGVFRVMAEAGIEK